VWLCVCVFGVCVCSNPLPLLVVSCQSNPMCNLGNLCIFQKGLGSYRPWKTSEVNWATRILAMWSFQNEILTLQEKLGFGSAPYEETVGFPAGNVHEAIHSEFLECLMRNPDGMCMLAAMRHVPFKGQFAKSVEEIVQEIVPQEEEECEEEGFTTFQKVLAELKKIMESPPVPEEFLAAARERDEHEKKVKEFKEEEEDEEEEEEEQEQEQKAKEEQKSKEQEQNKKRARTN
jgi:hypothetical protein